MLVLARKIGDSIMIGDDIEIKIVDTQGDKVRIGIEAPKNITVLRKELFDAASEANVQAASPDVDLDILKGFGTPEQK